MKAKEDLTRMNTDGHGKKEDTAFFKLLIPFIPVYPCLSVFIRVKKSWLIREPRVVVNRETINDRLKLMYHRLVARRLARDHSLVDDARKVVWRWQGQPNQKTFVREWDFLLSQSPDDIRRILSSRSEDATRLRLSSPFPHVERLRVGDEDTRRRMWSKARMDIAYPAVVC